MKRFLNLNDFGAKMILAIAILGIGIPALLGGISLVFDAMKIQCHALHLLMRDAIITGGVLLLVLLVLLIFEQIQDHLLYQKYLKERGKRIRGGPDGSECPFCGYRGLKEFEAYCPICGHKI
jgi:hypothetical protein